MILPATATSVWILAIVALLCLGSWANTLKLAGKWRFEYFYYDFVVGILLCAGLAALVLGSADSQQLTLLDNWTLTGYRKIAWALGSGVVLNLGMMLLMAAMTISGMSVAFPLTFGVALVISTVWDFTLTEQVNTALTLEGVILLLAAIVAAALIHIRLLRVRREAGQHTALRPDPRVKQKRARTQGAGLAIVLAIAGGIALSIFPRTLAEGTSGENGLAPYLVLVLLAISAAISSPFFVLFFTTFPVAGVAGKLGGYLSGDKKQHLLGVAGGILWGAGMLSSLLVAAAPPHAQLNGMTQYGLENGALLVATAWGLLAWRETHGTGQRVHTLMAGMLVLFVAGLGVVAFAFTQK